MKIIRSKAPDHIKKALKKMMDRVKRENEAHGLPVVGVEDLKSTRIQKPNKKMEHKEIKMWAVAYHIGSYDWELVLSIWSKKSHAEDEVEELQEKLGGLRVAEVIINKRDGVHEKIELSEAPRLSK